MQLLAVIVNDGNIVRNQIIDLDEPMDEEQVLRLNLLLNTRLNGLTIDEISLGLITKLKEEAGIHSDVVSSVIDAVAEAISADDEVPVYTSGATNIFKYPELADPDKASELISALEDKNSLVDMLREEQREDEGPGTGIQVYLGGKSQMESMKDCAVVTATYDLGNGMKGTVGIIGPKRMDYENVVDNLKVLKKELDTIFNDKGKDKSP